MKVGIGRPPHRENETAVAVAQVPLPGPLQWFIRITTVVFVAAGSVFAVVEMPSGMLALAGALFLGSWWGHFWIYRLELHPDGRLTCESAFTYRETHVNKVRQVSLRWYLAATVMRADGYILVQSGVRGLPALVEEMKRWNPDIEGHASLRLARSIGDEHPQDSSNSSS